MVFPPDGCSTFKAAWWLPGPHLQTMWPAIARHESLPGRRRERLTTSDGDFVDLDWHGDGNGPIVILLHGLTGSSESVYILGLQKAIAKIGWRSVVMNFRGCSGMPNDTARCYHSGDTDDLAALYRELRRREPDAPMAAVGISLGGNVLLKWLGESAGAADLFAACGISVPFQLDLCASRLDRGVSRLYRDQLMAELKAYMARKTAYLLQSGYVAEAAKLMELGELAGVRSFWDYDGRVVAGLYDFRDAADYYGKCSSRRFLAAITVPTLLIQARDDPFVPPEALPAPQELAPAVALELSARGGHVGFVSGCRPGHAEYWLDRRVPEFLSVCLENSAVHLRNASPVYRFQTLP